MRIKHKAVVFILAIMTSLLSIAIFSDNYIYQSVITSIGKQNARVDIKNSGLKSNTVKLISHESENVKLTDPNWFKNADGIGKVLEFKIKRHWKPQSFTFLAVGDGNLQIHFRGKVRNINGKRYPALVDYKNIYVNGKKYTGDKKTTWHDQPYTITFQVKDGDKIILNMEARKHTFRLSDVQQYYHTNFRMVLAVFIVSCLLYSFLVSMYAKGRSMGGRRSDMLFLVGFFIMLVIPMLHLSEEKVSKSENRGLAVYDPILRNGKFNMEYGNKVDKWFSDRFFCREHVITMYKDINLNVNAYPRFGGIVYNKNTGWMFRESDLSWNIPQNTVSEAISNVNDFYTWLKKRNINLYTLIVPCNTAIIWKKHLFIKNQTPQKR